LDYTTKNVTAYSGCKINALKKNVIKTINVVKNFKA